MDNEVNERLAAAAPVETLPREDLIRECRRLRLVERILLGLSTTEGRALAVCAIEAADAMRNNLAPGPWSEVKRDLLNAAADFEKVTRR